MLQRPMPIFLQRPKVLLVIQWRSFHELKMKALVEIAVEVNHSFKIDLRLHVGTIGAGLSTEHSHRSRAARLRAWNSSHVYIIWRRCA